MYSSTCTVKPMLNGHSQEDRRLIFKTNYSLMQVKSKLPIVIKIFVLSIFEWPVYTGFTVFLTIQLGFMP